MFSNFYKGAPFKYQDILFYTSEQFYAFMKCLVFNDTNNARLVLKCLDPKSAKNFGRSIKRFNDSIWDNWKQHVMFIALREKFTQNTLLMNALASTAPDMLVEASKYDRIWGIGYSITDAEKNKHKWGTNLLGKLLTRLRDNKGFHNLREDEIITLIREFKHQEEVD